MQFPLPHNLTFKYKDVIKSGIKITVYFQKSGIKVIFRETRNHLL